MSFPLFLVNMSFCCKAYNYLLFDNDFPVKPFWLKSNVWFCIYIVTLFVMAGDEAWLDVFIYAILYVE
ncbi:MAG: hypothetical protein D3908_10955 [Candidatus Electrothrix sp. AUS4]|nr:hypothetical protein [Candidatus Electrothrix sp. AUS4]